MKRFLILFTLLATCANATFGQNRTSDDIAKTIAPFVEESTIAVVRIDLTRVQLDPLFKRFDGLIQTLVGEGEKQQAMRQIEAAKTLVQMYVSALTRAGASEFFAVITLEPLPEPPLLVVVPLNEKVNEDALTPLVQMVTLQMPVEQKRMGDAIVIGSKAHVAQLKLGKGERLDELKRTFAATSGSAIQLAVIPPRYAYRAIEELVVELPKQLGGGPGTRFTDGCQWAAMGIDLPPNFKLDATVQSKNAAAAGEFGKLMASMFAAAREESDGQLPDALIARLTPRVQKDQLRWTLTDKDLDGLVADVKPVIQEQQKQAKRVVSMNHMRRIAIALLAYTGKHNDAFPPDLGTLLDAKVIVQPDTFLSPLSGDSLPDGFGQLNDKQKKQWINQHASYIYIPDVDAKQDSESRLILIEKSSSAFRGKVTAAYQDGSVQLVTIKEVDAQLIKQTGVGYEQWNAVAAGKTPAKK